MKRIDAMLKPSAIDDVKEALSAVGIHGMTLLEAKGFGRQKGHQEIYRGTEYAVDFVPKVQIVIVVADDQVDAVVGAIMGAAKTGKIGDGKIFVSDVTNVYRIRTGETGADAL
ncbi:MAG: P-II family nitrogen regulator [Myxococcales bacterium]|nr:P-II family nitrogen regulator [Myxococcales bacterium]